MKASLSRHVLQHSTMIIMMIMMMITPMDHSTLLFSPWAPLDSQLE
jgi:hypothetical protein